MVVGISREPARRTAETAVDLVSGLFVATEREVGIANRTTEFDQCHVQEIGESRAELERPVERTREEPAPGPLSLLAGREEGLEPDGDLPTGSRPQHAIALDQQPLATGLGGDQREARFRVEDQ